jgi:hypothetical protein
MDPESADDVMARHRHRKIALRELGQRVGLKGMRMDIVICAEFPGDG